MMYLDPCARIDRVLSSLPGFVQKEADKHERTDQQQPGPKRCAVALEETIEKITHKCAHLKLRC